MLNSGELHVLHYVLHVLHTTIPDLTQRDLSIQLHDSGSWSLTLINFNSRNYSKNLILPRESHPALG